jgi:hypothetical protein
MLAHHGGVSKIESTRRADASPRPGTVPRLDLASFVARCPADVHEWNNRWDLLGL